MFLKIFLKNLAIIPLESKVSALKNLNEVIDSFMIIIWKLGFFGYVTFEVRERYTYEV